MRHKHLTLSDFIALDMKKRGMSVVEYAAFIGVAHSTISKHLNKKKKIVPQMQFLTKLSGATGTSLEVLLAIAFPDLVQTALSPRAMLLAQRLDGLPEPFQDEVLRLVFGQSPLDNSDE